MIFEYLSQKTECVSAHPPDENTKPPKRKTYWRDQLSKEEKHVYFALLKKIRTEDPENERRMRRQQTYYVRVREVFKQGENTLDNYLTKN